MKRGDGTQDQPKGLRFQAAAANVFAANATVNVANVTSDLYTALANLEDADVPMIRPTWLMHPRSKNFLGSQRDANGNTVWPTVQNEPPTLLGFPLFTTTQIPIDLGAGSDESELYLADFSEVLLGEVEGIELEVSREAAYVDSGSNVVSAFQRNQSLVRAILRHDLAVRHAEAVTVMTGVTWTP